MILTTHALTGAVIGKNIHNTWLIVLISLFVHYTMDTFRHGEYFDDRTARFSNTWWKVAIDLLIAGSVISFSLLWQRSDAQTTINVLVGSFFSILPDGITLLYYFSGKKLFVRIKAFHSWAHRYSRFPKHSPERRWTLRNAVNDIIISVVAITLLLM